MAINPDDFEVTDTSPPPKSSIAYTDCGAQKISTECLLIPYGWGSAPGEVVRVRSTEEKLDEVILRPFRHSTRASALTPRSLPAVLDDMKAVEVMISSDPWKTRRETMPDTKGSKWAYLKKMESFLLECQDMSGGKHAW